MKNLLLAAALLLAVGAAQAQSGPPTTGPPTTNPLPPTAVPIDGGASLLLAGSVAYGLRRLRQKRRKAA
ncbi:PID-CTERM protein-sorting domain-containing protein [Hymenobacter psoromatis]|uniref:PID-CTERM protein-sorting domain-containing protein n=1 Tax=Hymenobacter psoromatis TaxID=1484116 RepID=UPI001CBD9441|nr:hypothetical protein [Hymenobacter psoromatis]